MGPEYSPRIETLCMVAALLTAIQVDAGAQDMTGEIVHAEWGVSFTVPNGWSGQLIQAGYIFGASAKPGFIAVMSHEAHSVEALRAEARRGITDGAGTLLRPTGAIKMFGKNGLAAEFSGTVDGNAAEAYAVGLVSPDGGGITVLAAATQKEFSGALRTIAEEVAATVTFDPLPAARPARAEQGAEEAEWQEFLTGCRLYINNSYNSGDGSGITDETTVDLCPGHFTFSDHSLTVFNEMNPVSGDDPYLHSDKQGAGEWSIIRRNDNSMLNLRFHDGRERSFTLGWEDGKTFLDGRRWLRGCNPNVSVGPQCR